MSDLLVYDVELNKEIINKSDWKKINPSWFAAAVVYSYEKNEYFFFLHQEGLINLKQIMNRSRVVSFNGVNFDSIVLLGRSRPLKLMAERCGIIVGNNSCFWNEYDLFIQSMKAVYNLRSDLEARKRISPGGFSLNEIAKRTLGLQKKGLGKKAPKLYQQKKYDELLEYTLQDVRITKLLFDHICSFGTIKNRDGKRIKLERTGSWFPSFKELNNSSIESEDIFLERFSNALLP